MRTKRLLLYISLFVALALSATTTHTPCTAIRQPFRPLGIHELTDSLNAYYNPFQTPWGTNIRVKQLRVKGDYITVRTNATLSGVVFSPAELRDLRKQISLWVLGKPSGKVTIYTNQYELGELIPDRLKKSKYKYPVQKQSRLFRHTQSTHFYPSGLSQKTIALWPSHGTYYHSKKDLWRWQRATLYTTVEDLYSVEYTRLVTTMLENAGAVVLSPRARYQGPNLRLTPDSTWALVDDQAGQELGQSGLPRWAEGARYWLEEAGYPDTIWGMYDGEDDYKADLQCRGLWLNYLTGGSRQNPHNEGFAIPVDVCLALHTDGIDAVNDTTIVGTLAIYTDHDEEKKKTFPNGISRQVNRNLADYVQTQIVDDIRQTIAPEWTRRQLHNANYCESRYPLVPSVLIEILSHKNFADMHYGLDPRFRFIAARAIYKGLLRYLHSQDGRKIVVQPLPISHMGMQLLTNDHTKKKTTNHLHLHWTPTLDPIEPTAQPEYYYIYSRQNDGLWEMHKTQDTTFTIPIERGIRYDFYIEAANQGGKSLPSETLSAYLSTKKQAPIGLIINNFNQTYGPEWFADSLYAGIVPGTYAVENHYNLSYIGEQHDFVRQHPWIDDDNCGWGMCYRDHQATPTIGNTFDYPVLHGRVLQQMDYSYLSANAQSIQQIDTIFTFVDLICGKEKATDSTDILTPILQQTLQDYLTKGGKLLLSGMYLGSGMQTNEAKEWAKNYLHYTFYAPRATYSGQINLTPISHTPTFIVQLRTKPNAEGLFAEAPEALLPTDPLAQRIATYTDMRTPAAVFYTDILQQTRTLVYGFPLETAVNFNELYQYSIQRLLQ